MLLTGTEARVGCLWGSGLGRLTALPAMLWWGGVGLPGLLPGEEVDPGGTGLFPGYQEEALRGSIALAGVSKKGLLRLQL